MKKKLLYLILIAFVFCTYNASIALETESSDYKVVQVTENNEEVSLVYETSNIAIVKKDNKYGVFDKTNNKYFIKPALDSIENFTKNNDFEYKIKTGEMLGYMNLLTKDTFLSYFNDISIIDNKYLKVKKDDKFGIVDKKGRVIVPLEYKKVAVTKYDNVEYLIGSGNGKYDAYYNDGTLITKKDLSEINKTSYGVSVARDLNPLLKEFRFSLKKSEEEKVYVVENETETEKDTEQVETISETEIQQLPVPTRTGVNKEQETETQEGIKLNVEEEIANNTNVPEVEINTEPIPQNVKKLLVRHEDFNSQMNTLAKANETVDVVTLNKRSYFITNNKGKIGLQTKNGVELIPAKYTALKVKTLNQKINNQIIAAVDVKGNATKLYDSHGYVLAKRFHDKINVYTSMRKYEYYLDGDKYSIDFDGRKIGEIKLLDDGSYIYTKTAFNLSNMKKANELFLTLIESEK